MKGRDIVNAINEAGSNALSKLAGLKYGGAIALAVVIAAALLGAWMRGGK